MTGKQSQFIWLRLGFCPPGPRPMQPPENPVLALQLVALEPQEGVTGQPLPLCNAGVSCRQGGAQEAGGPLRAASDSAHAAVQVRGLQHVPPLRAVPPVHGLPPPLPGRPQGTGLWASPWLMPWFPCLCFHSGVGGGEFGKPLVPGLLASSLPFDNLWTHC